jgi:MFS family permease
MDVHPAPSAIALVLGAIAGALAFLLAALFVGAPFGALVALVATILALRRRSVIATVAFAAATTLSAAAAIAPAATLVIAAALFGVGLYLESQRAADEEAIGPQMSTAEHSSLPTAGEIEEARTEITADERG